MKAPFSYIPAMPAALGIMVGIVLFYICPSWAIPVSAIIIGAVTFAFKRHWFTFCAFFVAFGWLLSSADKPSDPPADAWNVRSVWSGEVSAVRSTSSATRLTVVIDSCDSNKLQPFKTALLLPTPTDLFMPGDILQFTARLYNPDLSADVPDENRFNPTFFVDGITAQANVSPDDISIIRSLPTLKRTSLEWQAGIQDLIYKAPISSKTAWFLSATLIGDDSLLDPSLIQSFRTIGAAHYLALSGFHIGIIAMLASIAFFPLKTWSKVGRLRHLFVIALIWLYAFACGMSPSLVRAAILISIFLLAKVLQRQSSPYNSLCIAAVAILAFSPRQLFAPGFQLSFCAVLSILTFSRPLNPIKNRRSRLYNLTSFLTVPLAAMLGTCLVTIFHFHRFPLLFLIPNLLLAVLLPILLTLGVILILASAVGLNLTFIGSSADFIYQSIDKLCVFLSSFPKSEISGIFLTPATIVAALISIILLAVGLNYHRRILLICSALSLSLAILIQLQQPYLPDVELYVTRQPTRTDIVIRDNDTAVIFTTAPDRYRPSIAERLSMRYSNFLSRRNCNTTLTVLNSDFTLPSVRLRNDYLVFGSKIIYIPTTSQPVYTESIPVDYLIISRVTGNQAFDLIKKIPADTVIITRDVPALRAQRLIDSCLIGNKPYLHLKNHPFSLKITTR